jgi:hypothetical protein
MHDIVQKQIFFYKLPELEPDPDLVVKFPDPAKRSGFGSATLLSTKAGRLLIPSNQVGEPEFRINSF